MTDSEILTLAEQRGYTIGAESDTTEEIINDFLEEQELKYEFTQSELNAMTISEIESIATARGYTITETLKADIIAEFLELQNA